MKKLLTTTALAGAAAVLLTAGSSVGVSAAPLTNAGVKAAVVDQTIEVQRRGWRRNRAAIGIGAFGLGVVAGAAIANNRGYYHEPYGYYEQPYGYYQHPGYYGYQQRHIDDHTGGNH